MRRALELDPLSPRMHLDAAWLLLAMHRFGEAAAQAGRALTLAPESSEAKLYIETAKSYEGNRPAGPAGAADPYLLALHYALSGDRVRALRELNHASQSRSVMMPLLRIDPVFSAMRGEPAFEALVAAAIP